LPERLAWGNDASGDRQDPRADYLAALRRVLDEHAAAGAGTPESIAATHAYLDLVAAPASLESQPVVRLTRQTSVTMTQVLRDHG
jgi:hypothetical protein